MVLTQKPKKGYTKSQKENYLLTSQNQLYKSPSIVFNIILYILLLSLFNLGRT